MVRDREGIAASYGTIAMGSPLAMADPNRLRDYLLSLLIAWILSPTLRSL